MVIPTYEGPSWPISTVPGHESKLVFGRLDGKIVIDLVPYLAKTYPESGFDKLKAPELLLYFCGRLLVGGFNGLSGKRGGLILRMGF